MAIEELEIHLHHIDLYLDNCEPDHTTSSQDGGSGWGSTLHGMILVIYRWHRMGLQRVLMSINHAHSVSRASLIQNTAHFRLPRINGELETAVT